MIASVRSTALTVAGAAVAALAVAAARPTAAAGDSRVRRGEYLVKFAGCSDCHTPLKMGPQGPEPDRARLLSGHPAGMQLPPPPRLPEGPWMTTVAATNTAWAGPWGVSYTANLTPDPETGLGRWTETNFVETIRSGRHMGRGRAILPPMPVEAIANLTDDDLRAVFAYLRSIPPVRNAVPEPIAPVAAR